MQTTLEKFGHFVICRTADDKPVELRQGPTEVVFLAFDSRVKRLVELHVLTGTAALSKGDRQKVLNHCKLATEVRGPGCMRVLDAGEDADTIYFCCNVSDGERAEDYITRRGALPQVTVFCLMQQFLDDLIATPNFVQFASHVSAENPMVTMLEDSFLQLRIVDYTMGANISEYEADPRRVVAECCRLLFLLLTGQTFDGQNPDQFPALTCLPTNLRTQLRSALLDGDNASHQLEKLREDVREAYAALVSNLQLRTSRKHIVVTEALQPKSQLWDLLLKDVPLAELLAGRFELVAAENTRHPFSFAAVNVKTDQPVTVHLLPPSAIVPRNQYEAVPLQMWRFNAEKHPNILRSLSVWENPAWTFLTEEREPGFSLGRLVAERLTLNPAEVLIVLRQVIKGLEQAQECGVRKADLHPSNLLLRVGKGGAMQDREFERLVQKRIDAWPPFVVKLRTHMTMRGLYEPPLVEAFAEHEIAEPHLQEREIANRAFVALAVYLLTGERQAGQEPVFAETVSDPLARYLRDCVSAHRHPVPFPSPAEFVEAFEKRMEQASPEGRGFAAIMAANAKTNVETEDAGVISDFDEDHYVMLDEDSDSPPRPSTTPNYLLTGSATRKSFAVNSFAQERESVPGRAGMLIWGACAAVLLLVGWFAFFAGGHGPDTSKKGEARLASEPAAAAQFSAAPNISAPRIAEKHVAEGGNAVAKTSAQSPSVNPAVTPRQPQTSPEAPALSEPSGPITIKKAIVPGAKEVGEAKKDASGAVVIPTSSSSLPEFVESNTRTLH